MTQYRLDITAAPSDAERAVILANLRAYNDTQNEAMRVGRANEDTPIHILVRDENDTIVGGLIAKTYWGWLYLDLLWLSDTVRGQGIGARLVAMAEAEAIQRGCRWSKVETFGFQARGFYEKQGYTVVGQVDDLPPGSCEYILRKVLG